MNILYYLIFETCASRTSVCCRLAFLFLSCILFWKLFVAYELLHQSSIMYDIITATTIANRFLLQCHRVACCVRLQCYGPRWYVVVILLISGKLFYFHYLFRCHCIFLLFLYYFIFGSISFVVMCSSVEWTSWSNTCTMRFSYPIFGNAFRWTWTSVFYLINVNKYGWHTNRLSNTILVSNIR